MIVALVIAVASGALIAHPPFSILGALRLVGATILFALAGTWIVRNSWDPTEWSNISVSAEKALQRLRRNANLQLALGPLGIGLSVWAFMLDEPTGWIYLFLGISSVVTAATTLRALKKTELDEIRNQAR